MPKNIVLLTIDALRADHVSSYGYQRDTTPFLAEFAQEALLFKNAYSASSHTREAVPALLTGQHPSAAVSEGFTRGADTIPMVLPDDYLSGAFHSNPYVSRAYGYDTGFDFFDDDLRLGQNKLLALVQRALDKFVFSQGEYHARATEINDRSLSWLNSVDTDRPFFLWNHYMDVHGPYNPPDGYAQWSDPVSDRQAQRLYDRLSGDDMPSQTEVDCARDLYDGEIRYTDEYIRRFVTALEERDLLEESVVIITADHGDLFGEYGQYAHPRQVYPELTRVPLLIWKPATSGKSVETPVSTLDLMPTILNIVNRSSESLPGESLISPAELPSDRYVYSSTTGEGDASDKRRYAVQSQNWGYRFTRVQSSGDSTDEVAFRLPSGASVEVETVDETDRERIDHLREQLLAHSAQSQTTEVQAGGEAKTNAEIEERLEALGYK